MEINKYLTDDSQKIKCHTQNQHVHIAKTNIFGYTRTPYIFEIFGANPEIKESYSRIKKIIKIKVLSRLGASQTKQDKHFAEENSRKYGGKITEKENNTTNSSHSDDDNKRTGKLANGERKQQLKYFYKSQ